MFVSVLMVRALVHVCGTRGVSRADLLDRSDLSDSDLADLHLRVPGALFADIAQRAMDLTRDPGLGLALGAEVPEHALQIVGYLIRSSPTLRDAYQSFARYSTLLADNPTWVLHERGSDAELEYTCPIVELAVRRMSHDWSMALAHRCIKSFTPHPALWPSRVELSFPRPSYAARYSTLFDCDVRFNRNRSALVFPRALLDQPQLHGDSAVCGALQTTAEELLQRGKNAQTTADRIRTLLQHEPDLARVDVETIAQRAGLSQSALRRALALEGMSPSSLVDEARCRKACAELAGHEPSVKGIAEALGYADTSSFNRAFRRWTGTTPAAYRRARRVATHSPAPGSIPRFGTADAPHDA